MQLLVPPGIQFLFPRISKALVIPISVYLLLTNARNAAYLDLSHWLIILVSVLTLPLAFIAHTNWKVFKTSFDARSLGAISFPQVPARLPGSLDVLMRMNKTAKTGYLGHVAAEWIKTLGYTVNVRILFATRIFTSEPEYIKMMLATNFDNYEKGPSFRGYMESLLGTGVFNSDGEMWKFHRSMSRPFFTRDKISHFDIFDRHAEDTISQVKARLKEGEAVDIQDAMLRFTLDSASEFLFGADVHSLSAGLPYPKTSHLSATRKVHRSDQFANSFMAAQSAAAARSRYGDSWPLGEFWEDKVKKEMTNVYAFVDPIIRDALARKKDSEIFAKDDEEEDVLLAHLIKITDDPRVIRDEVLDLMVAGRDTTAASITFALVMLAEHPHVFQRLRAEVLETLGTSRRPSPEDLRDMKYLRAVINETLRLYPPIPFNVRTTIKPAVWPSLNGGKPYYIPANTRCLYSPFLMHRREDLWGPDALEFDPDRFLDDRVRKYLTPNPFIFLPFNAGPRICLGQQFAYNEASFMLIRLLQAFKSIRIDLDAHPDARPPTEWTNGDGRQSIEKVWLKSHLTAYANNGVWVRMEETGVE